MARDREAELQLSRTLQSLARGIDGGLQELCGEPVPFVVVIQVAGAAQYIANTSREDGIKLLEGLLERWRSGMPDVPEHEKQ